MNRMRARTDLSSTAFYPLIDKRNVFFFFPTHDFREKPPPVKESRSSPPTWLQRDLRVRFIDKTFKGGKYYNSKVVIHNPLLEPP